MGRIRHFLFPTCHALSIDTCRALSIATCHAHPIANCHAHPIATCHAHHIDTCRALSIATYHVHPIATCRVHPIATCRAYPILNEHSLCSSVQSVVGKIYYNSLLLHHLAYFPYTLHHSLKNVKNQASRQIVHFMLNSPIRY